MSQNENHSNAGYKQASKQIARSKALTHAVELLTTRREDCAIVPRDYIDKVVAKMSDPSQHPDYTSAAKVCKTEDIESWKNFRKSVVGSRTPSELTVAYLSGPEPTNDLEVLIELGVRPENIWAFEIDKDAFTSAVVDIERTKLRGVKLMNVSIEDYFLSTPRRFDIIYFDACGPLPSKTRKTTQAIVNIFRHSALASQGVLITNFSEPDITKKEVVDNYGHLIAAYLYPKAFLDSFDDPDQTWTDGAGANGYDFGLPPEEYRDEYEEKNDFINIVKTDFSNYYGAFITRHIADIASIISPTIRLLNASLHKEIITNIKDAAARGRRFVTSPIEDESHHEDDTATNNIAPGLNEELQVEQNTFEMDGDAFTDPNMYSLLFTLAACDISGVNYNVKSTTPEVKKFCHNWLTQLSGKPSVVTASDAIACFYTLRHDKDFWAAPLERISNFNYRRNMRFLCDVPTEEIAFYPAFAQVSYPSHSNIKESKRYSYLAEGKQTKMLLDVMPFDECRYIYDWLSTAPLIGSDWQDESRQLVFRFALDCIAKNIRWYQDDFLYGCHSVSIDSEYFDPPCYKPREEIVSTTI
ncbi:hypothetical protein ACXUPC_10765 [Pseudomonas marginalis]|jgi:hypothetical protein|uniref:hypothetical protein n=1 Tax=Pseudomonas marginalis TaxID=298 RepID=UPI0038B675A8